MAEIQGTNIIAPVVPFDTTDSHPTHEAQYGKGGYRVVATNASRDAIPSPRREEGMLVFVASTGKTWRLGADLATWSEQVTASTWADITGKPSTFTPSAHTHTQADVGSSLGNSDLAADLQDILFQSSVASNLAYGTIPEARLPGTVVLTTDSRLSDSREWSASTVSQAEAEAGTATTRRAYTAQRVFQAIAAWWSASGIQTTIDGKASATHADTHGTAGSDPIGAAALSQSQMVSTLGGVDIEDDIDYLYQTVTDHADRHGISGADPITPASIGAADQSHTHTQSQVESILGGSVLSDDISYLNNNKAASSHTHAASDITSGTFDATRLPLGTTSVRGALIVGTGLGVSSGTVSVSYGTTSTTACVGNDSRLSDARTALSHSHGNISNSGAIGSTSGLPVRTTTAGVLTTGSFGSTAGTFCEGSDSRLSDSRTPTGAAGGDLTGTYPNPTIAAGAVTLSKTTGIQKSITISNASPTGGSDGDIWLKY